MSHNSPQKKSTISEQEDILSASLRRVFELMNAGKFKEARSVLQDTPATQIPTLVNATIVRFIDYNYPISTQDMKKEGDKLPTKVTAKTATHAKIAEACMLINKISARALERPANNMESMTLQHFPGVYQPGVASHAQPALERDQIFESGAVLCTVAYSLFNFLGDVVGEINWLKLSASRGFGPAYARLSVHYQFGVGNVIQRSATLACTFAELGARIGNPICAFILSINAKSMDERIKWCEFAADRNNSSAMVKLAAIYHRTSSTNPEHARMTFELLNRAMDYAPPSEAYHCLARCYSDGIGTPVDKNKAIELFRVAFAKKYPKSRLYLGAHLALYATDATQFNEGIAILTDIVENERDVSAMKALGQAYSRKDGSFRNHASSMKWQTMAASTGDMDSLHAVGSYYASSGERAKAIEYLSQAANLGHRQSANMLFEMHQADRAGYTNMDPDAAGRWADRIAEIDDANASTTSKMVLNTGFMYFHIGADIEDEVDSNAVASVGVDTLNELKRARSVKWFIKSARYFVARGVEQINIDDMAEVFSDYPNYLAVLRQYDLVRASGTTGDAGIAPFHGFAPETDTIFII